MTSQFDLRFSQSHKYSLLYVVYQHSFLTFTQLVNYSFTVYSLQLILINLSPTKSDSHPIVSFSSQSHIQLIFISNMWHSTVSHFNYQLDCMFSNGLIININFIFVSSPSQFTSFYIFIILGIKSQLLFCLTLLSNHFQFPIANTFSHILIFNSSSLHNHTSPISIQFQITHNWYNYTLPKLFSITQTYTKHQLFYFLQRKELPAHLQGKN